MQPSKSMVDYKTEYMLFPQNPVTDVSTPSSSDQRSFSQRTFNYSSSSTDSYSPDTFPELSYTRSNQYRRPEYRTVLETPKIAETPFALTRRPIVGRKILGSTPKPVEQRIPEERLHDTKANTPMSPIRFWEGSNTPQERRYTKYTYYDLFSGENKCFEIKTPVKTTSVLSNMSPSSPMSQDSPVNSNYGMLTPPRYNTPLMLGANSPMNVGVKSPPMGFGVNLPMNVGVNSPMNVGVNSRDVKASSPMRFGASSPMNLSASTSRFQDGPQKMCTFCRKNGETPLVYMTHMVKEKRGARNIVTCPILRSHVCSTCGVSGDNAHTITYCPVLRSSNNGMPLKSTTVTLKNTRIKSNGRRRY